MGLEVAGEVVAVGPGTGRWRVGDEVCALLAGGGYAQYVALDGRQAMAVPAGLGMVEAAALPETALTVFSNVFERARLATGETLLVHGATSGIGVMAILMGKAAGARVFATGRGTAKAGAARDLGADVAIDSAADDWVRAVTAEGGADVVLDMVGGSYLAGNLSVLKQGGRLALIAFLGGARAELDFATLLTKRLTITASTLRARPPAKKGRLTAAVEERVWPWVATGQVWAVVDRVFPLAEAGSAHAYLESGEAVGKVILKV